MVKWEYNFVHIQENVWTIELLGKLQRASEALGAEGWELVNVLHLTSGFQAFFKRPKFT